MVSPLLPFLLVVIPIVTLPVIIYLDHLGDRGHPTRWHTRYECRNCGRMVRSDEGYRCGTCGSPERKNPIIVRRLLPFVWEQMDEDEFHTGKRHHVTRWSRLAQLIVRGN